MKVEIWSDIVCPFCYIGNTQFNKALENFAHKDKVQVIYRSFQLQPDAPKQSTGKKSLEDLAVRKGLPEDSIKEMFSSVTASGKQAGLTMNMFGTTVVNTFDSHQLVHFAAKQGKQEEVIQAVYKAYFTDNLDVSDKKVLLGLVENLDLDAKEFEKSLESNEFAGDVQADIHKAAAIGVQGVPFFVIDDTFGISGARGVEAFSSALDRAWKESHPLHMLDEGDTSVCADGACI